MHFFKNKSKHDLILYKIIFENVGKKFVVFCKANSKAEAKSLIADYVKVSIKNIKFNTIVAYSNIEKPSIFSIYNIRQ